MTKKNKRNPKLRLYLSLLESFLEKAGGVFSICYDLEVSQSAVSRWKRRGIPLDYWPYFIDKGVSLEQLYECCYYLRDKYKKRNK